MNRWTGFQSMITEDAWQALALAGIRKDFAALEQLVTHGDVSDHVYVIISGRILILNEDQPRRHVVAVRGAGDLIGEFSAADGQPRSATAVAIEQVQTVVLAKESFDKAIASLGLRTPLTRYQLLKSRQSVTHGFRDSNRFIRARLASLFLALHSVGYGRSPNARTIPLTHEYLASVLGAARNGLTPIINEMEKNGIVQQSKHKNIKLIDIDKLKTLAETTKL